MGCGSSRSVAAVEPEPDDRGAAKAAVFLPTDATKACDVPVAAAKGKSSSLQSDSPENPQDYIEEPATAAPSPAADHQDWANGRPIDDSSSCGAGDTLPSWGPAPGQDRRAQSADRAPASGEERGAEDKSAGAGEAGAKAAADDRGGEDPQDETERIRELKKENAELQRLAHEYLEGLENELVTEMHIGQGSTPSLPLQPAALGASAAVAVEQDKDSRRAELEGLEREILENFETPPGKAQSTERAAALLRGASFIDEVDSPPGPKPPRVSSPSSTAAGVAGQMTGQLCQSASARNLAPHMHTVAASDLHRITNEVWDFDIETSPPSGISSPVALSSPMSRTSCDGNIQFGETGLPNLAFLEAELEDVLAKLSVSPSKCSSRAQAQVVTNEC